MSLRTELSMVARIEEAIIDHIEIEIKVNTNPKGIIGPVLEVNYDSKNAALAVLEAMRKPTDAMKGSLINWQGRALYRDAIDRALKEN